MAETVTGEIGTLLLSRSAAGGARMHQVFAFRTHRGTPLHADQIPPEHQDTTRGVEDGMPPPPAEAARLAPTTEMVPLD